jgi:HAD superfamily hydrolase (TIGR01459 family)
MRDLSQLYPVWFVDIWGVVHNGVDVFTPTVDVLAQHRAAGGVVILVSNSPRSEKGIKQQLDDIGVRRDAYDDAVTSGDVTQTLMRQAPSGKLFHLGPERDVSIFDGIPVTRVSKDEAGAVLCTGLFHDTRETPADYQELLTELHGRNLPMICANPDKTVRKGNEILFCAGALAEVYQKMGGAVSMAGKPYQPIYELALKKAAQHRGKPVSKTEILAIGDGPETDVTGAANQGFPVVYVAGGVRERAADLAAEKSHIEKLVPTAQILRAVHHLDWA